MKRLVVPTVAVIGAFAGALAVYLFWVGALLNRIADNVEDSADLVGKIDEHAKVIRPGVAHINRVGGVVAGALPLLYGMAEQIVRGLAAKPLTSQEPENGGTSGARRSRLHDAVGYESPSSDELIESRRWCGQPEIAGWPHPGTDDHGRCLIAVLHGAGSLCALAGCTQRARADLNQAGRLHCRLKWRERGSDGIS